MEPNEINGKFTLFSVGCVTGKMGMRPNDFSSKAGSKQCREIRGMRSLSCSGCVTLSAYLLEQHMDEVKAVNLTSHGAFMANISEIASGRENVLCPGGAQN